MKDELTPKKYFTRIKELKQEMSTDELQIMYDKLLSMANVYYSTGQTQGLQKIMFYLESIKREQGLLEMGLDTFVYRQDISEYIDKVSDNVVKIIDLESFERELPLEVANALIKVKDKFDQFYIVFTDYTGEVESQVEKSRREKDPILFGVFKSEELNIFIDRFYYIADWVDEYCDLTLEKMLSDYEVFFEESMEQTIDNVEGIESKSYDDLLKALGKPKKESIFDKIVTFLTRKK